MLKTKKRGPTAKGSQKLRTQTNRKQTERVARRGHKGVRGERKRADLARCAGEIVRSIKGLEEIEFSIYSHKLCAIPFTTPSPPPPLPTQSHQTKPLSLTACVSEKFYHLTKNINFSLQPQPAFPPVQLASSLCLSMRSICVCVCEFYGQPGTTLLHIQLPQG